MEELRFRDGLVCTVGLTVQTKLWPLDSSKILVCDNHGDKQLTSRNRTESVIKKMKRFKDPRQRLEISHAVQEDCKKKKNSCSK